MREQDVRREMTIAAVRDVADGIREFTLASIDGQPLEDFAAGAHIECAVMLPDGQRAVRAYSLINAPAEIDAYRIAVARAQDGRGGSAFMHGLAPGMTIGVGRPRNDFPLEPDAMDSLLIAGGIGITPILAMARALGRAGRSFTIHYAGRSRGAMAYGDEVAAMPGAALVCDGGDPGKGLAIAELVAGPRLSRHLYVCGPRPLIEAVLAAARAAGWPESHLHFELFGAEQPSAGDRAFTVEFARSGRTAEIPVGSSILDVMEQLGLAPLFDCRRGECGVCLTDVIDGLPDHRDMNLSQREKDAGKLICTCVSRARTERLVLDA